MKIARRRIIGSFCIFYSLIFSLGGWVSNVGDLVFRLLMTGSFIFGWLAGWTSFRPGFKETLPRVLLSTAAAVGTVYAVGLITFFNPLGMLPSPIDLSKLHQSAPDWTLRIVAGLVGFFLLCWNASPEGRRDSGPRPKQPPQ